MTIVEALISGIVQGVTEFIPVSSSAHLVFVHKLFGSGSADILFDVSLHLATLCAILLYFSRDIIAIICERNFKMMGFVILGCVPAVIAGALFEDKITPFFGAAREVSAMLIITAIFLFIGQAALVKKNAAGGKANFLRSIFVGVVQIAALLPGVSRSGTTISAGLVAGMDREEAFRFSFLMAIPLIAGATLFELVKTDISVAPDVGAMAYAVGISAAFAAGFISLGLLSLVIKRRSLFIFGLYCLIIGVSGILYFK